MYPNMPIAACSKAVFKSGPPVIDCACAHQAHDVGDARSGGGEVEEGGGRQGDGVHEWILKIKGVGAPDRHQTTWLEKMLWARVR